MTTDPDRHPIFVVGTGRSGTTLLRMMLNAHPRIHLTHEASFYLLGGLQRRATPRDWLDRYLETAAFAWLRLDPAEVRRAAGFRPDSVAAVIRAMMILQARRHNKERYGDKTPLHAAKLRPIFEDFPNARVVNVVRDPRGGVASLLRMPWAASSIGLNLVFYEAGWKAVRAFRHRLHEVKLEDLIEQPEQTMRAVLDFLGEEFSPDVLRHHEVAPIDDLPPFPWFDGAKRPVAKREGPPAWQRDLPPAWIRIIERKLRRPMQEYGYEPARLAVEPSTGEILAARLSDLPEAIRSLRRLFAFLRMGKRRDLPPVKDQMEALLNLNPGAWRRYPGFAIPAPE